MSQHLLGNNLIVQAVEDIPKHWPGHMEDPEINGTEAFPAKSLTGNSTVSSSTANFSVRQTGIEL